MKVDERIADWLEEKFLEPELESCFLIEVKESQSGRKLEVYVDCDEGVNFDTCRLLSRYLEDKLETSNTVRDNYILEVSSPGATRPLVLLRQYPKHIGRKLKVKLNTGEELEGVLTEVSDTHILLERRIKEKQGKKKINKKIESEIEFNAIESSKVKLSF